MDPESKKFCFVLSPIGEPDSETRKRSNGYLREVLRPVAENDFHYQVERADHDKAPGVVTQAIVTKILEADLVIADLHGHNPNVMYEVAIRHATDRAAILMIEKGERLPFDISGLNTIQYDPSVDGLENWRDDLRRAITAVENGQLGSNPVAQAGIIRRLEAEGKPTEQALTEVLRSIATLTAEVRELRSSPKLHLVEAKRWRDTQDLVTPGEWITGMIHRFISEDANVNNKRFILTRDESEISVAILGDEKTRTPRGVFRYDYSDSKDVKEQWPRIVRQLRKDLGSVGWSSIIDPEDA